MDNLDELVDVYVLENSEDAEALEETAEGIKVLARNVDNKKGLFETEGLIEGLMRVMEKDGEGFREAREQAVMAIGNIAACDDDEVKKDLFEHEGLIAGLVEILGQKGSEYKTVREDAVGAIRNIA